MCVCVAVDVLYIPEKLESRSAVARAARSHMHTRIYISLSLVKRPLSSRTAGERKSAQTRSIGSAKHIYTMLLIIAIVILLLLCTLMTIIPREREEVVLYTTAGELEAKNELLLQRRLLK